VCPEEATTGNLLIRHSIFDELAEIALQPRGDGWIEPDLPVDEDTRREIAAHRPSQKALLHATGDLLYQWDRGDLLGEDVIADGCGARECVGHAHAISVVEDVGWKDRLQIDELRRVLHGRCGVLSAERREELVLAARRVVGEERPPVGKDLALSPIVEVRDPS